MKHTQKYPSLRPSLMLFRMENKWNLLLIPWWEEFVLQGAVSESINLNVMFYLHVWILYLGFLKVCSKLNTYNLYLCK